MAATLYLIDGHAQFFRAYFAIRSQMSSPVTGEPTNMVFGFASMLLKLLKEDAPEYLVVVIDVAGDQESFRSELYADYKANREEAPDDFGPQVDRCVELLETMGIPVLGEPAVEADDVIASLVRRLTREHGDLDIRIVSRDKDLAQLIGDRVELYDPHKSQAVRPSDIFKTDGVEPEQVRDILALMGDTSDNVPGVPGIGPKTAAKLIMEYGTIDGIYDHINEIKGKRRENLEASREQVALSRRLVTLVEDLDVDLDLADAGAGFSKWPVGAIVDLFKDLGFNRLQDEIKVIGQGGVADPGPDTVSGGEPGSLFAPVEVQRPPLGTYSCVKDISTLEDIVARALAAGAVAIDTETTSIRPRQAKLCGVSLAIEPGEAWYVPVRSPEPETHLDEATVLAAIAPLLESDDVTLIGHNIKYDLVVLRSAGAVISGPMVDTMVASFVADGSRSSHSMDALARGLLEIDCIPITDLIGKGATQRTFDTVELTLATTYAAEDADVTLRLHDALIEVIESEGLLELLDEVEMPLVPVLAEMEYNGIRVDPEELATQEAALKSRLEAIGTQIAHASPVPLNPDSPKQLAAVLFGSKDGDPPGLGLKPIKKGKTGPSTDQEVLERLSQDPSVTTELPGLILAYRQLSKLVSTYLIALADAINPETGRVHCSFHQTVAATGRLSSSDPNLQNIPIRTETGREIRRAFMASEGCRLIAADYSQIELRVLAHLSGDEALIRAFKDGEDIHRAVAAQVHGVEVSDVTSEQRSTAKMVNFGIVYGVTPWGLARRLGIDVSEAATIIDEYKERYAAIDVFLESCVEQATSQGYVETMLGRRRNVPQIHARNPAQQALGRRIAINTVVQGSAADLIKLAMIQLHDDLLEEPTLASTKLLLQIHDELVCEAPVDQASVACDHIVSVMEHAMELSVPLSVDSSIASSWYDAK